MDGDSGFPDLTLTKGGRLIFAELKVGYRKLTPAQADWMYVLRMVPGVEVYVWRPRDFEQIISVLTSQPTSAYASG
jgi:hypothetical protein